MLLHLWHLLWQSFLFTPTLISQNWGGVLVAVVFFFGKDWKQFKTEGWRAMIHRQDVKKDVYWAVGAYLVLFVWAVGHTVYQDHDALVHQNEKLTAQLKASGLKLTILTLYTGLGVFPQNLPGAPHNAPIAALVVSVIDTGAPTIADNWKLEIVTPSGKIAGTSPVAISQNAPLQLPIDFYHVAQIYNPQDALYLKTSTVPIPSGGKQTGILMFSVPELSLEEMRVPGTIYRISCTDVLDRKVSTEYRKTGIPASNLSVYPGMTPPLVLPEAKK